MSKSQSPKRVKPPQQVEALVVRDPVSISMEAEVKRIPVTVVGIQQTVEKVQSEIQHWVNKGKYTSVRIKLGSYQVLPDIPIALAAVAEGLTLLLTGPLQIVLANVVGQAILNVEFVSDALHHVARGRELILAGELEQAMSQFRTAIAIDRNCAPAHLSIGIALKLQQDRHGAALSFQRASELDPKGATGLEAEKLISTLRD